MKYKILILILFLSSLRATPQPRILIDEAHGASMYVPGEISILGAILKSQGFYLEPLYGGEITDEVLRKYDIYVLMFPQIPLTEKEKNAIYEFVKNGGKAVFVGNSPFQFSNENLNNVTEHFGVSFGDEKRALLKKENFNHKIFEYVSEIEMWGCRLEIASDVEVIAQVDGLPLIAIKNYGKGEVVFLGDKEPLENLKRDHEQFMFNLFSYLAEREIERIKIQYPIVVSTGEGEYGDYNMYVGTIHNHTKYSGDSFVEPGDLVLKAIELDYDFLAITDHESVEGSFEAIEFVREKNLQILIIPGDEDTSLYGHVLALNVKKDNPDSIPVKEFVDNIHNQGGIAILAHPSLYPESWREFEENKEGFDGYEILDAGYFGGEGSYAYANAFIGGTDAHVLESLGRVRVFIFAEELDVESFLQAILERRLVIYDPNQNLLIGEDVWTEEVLKREERAKELLESVDVPKAGSAEYMYQRAKKSFENKNFLLTEKILENLSLSSKIKVEILERKLVKGEENEIQILIENLGDEEIVAKIFAYGENLTFYISDEFEISKNQTVIQTIKITPERTGERYLKIDLLSQIPIAGLREKIYVEERVVEKEPEKKVGTAITIFVLIAVVFIMKKFS
ncbi:MAG: PHP domain-containing protein [Candidatus Methanofastidiosia archaeon]